MKNLILLSFFAIQLVLTAQEIIPIPVDTTSVWRIQRQHNNETCVFHYNSIYYINGTEFHNGETYYKIYEEGLFYTSSVNPQYPCFYESYDYTGVFLGFIRTEDGKTYSYSFGTEKLLMDFTLNIGDTLFSSICQEGKIIESIDSVIVGNEYRKRFNFTNSWYCNWMVEGVGHQRGLFESMDFPFERESLLICYGENYTPIFGNENCDITVGMEGKYEKNIELLIYPNPTAGKINIYFKDIHGGITSYMIIDIFGKTIFNEDVNSTKEKNLEINMENCNSGIYVLKIELTNQEIIYKKIVKN